jgi:hypothetical protein
MKLTDIPSALAALLLETIHLDCAISEKQNALVDKNPVSLPICTHLSTLTLNCYLN